MGVVFEVAHPAVREVHRTARPAWTVRENARRKLAWCRAQYPAHRILTADTVVVFRGRAIGKPANAREAAAFLRMFSGQAHHVYTGVAYGEPGQAPRCTMVRSRVTFRVLTAAVVREYLRRVHPLDKAGAYDINQHGALIIAACEGSRSNVEGLPLELVREWMA
jgi:septum formation protein